VSAKPDEGRFKKVGYGEVLKAKDVQNADVIGGIQALETGVDGVNNPFEEMIVEHLGQGVPGFFRLWQGQRGAVHFTPSQSGLCGQRHCQVIHIQLQELGSPQENCSRIWALC